MNGLLICKKIALRVIDQTDSCAYLKADLTIALPSDARANDNMYAAFDNLEARSGKPCYDQVVGKQRKDIIEGLVKRGKDMTKRLNNLRSEEGRMKKAQNGTVEKENERPADDDVGWTTVIKKRPSRGT